MLSCMKKRIFDIVCPDCQSTNISFIWDIPNNDSFAGKLLSKVLEMGSLYSCDTCCLKFKYPVAQSEIYDALYNNDTAETWDSKELRYDQIQVLQHISKYKNLNILDYWCYSGSLLSHIQGNRIFGIEINDTAAKRAEEVSGAKVFKDVSNLPTNLKFDVVIAMDIIEHMVSPKIFLKKLLDIATIDGEIILSTGNGNNFLWNIHKENWWYCSFNEHIAFISKKWLLSYAEELGYEVVDFKTYPYEKPNILSLSKYFVRIVLQLLFLWNWKFLESSFLKFFQVRYKSNYIWMWVSSDHLLTCLKKIPKKYESII